MIWQIFHYLQGFKHARWCRISAINSTTWNFDRDLGSSGCGFCNTFYFYPNLGRWCKLIQTFFQMGWFNHQLGMLIWVFPKIGVQYPQIIHFNRGFPLYTIHFGVPLFLETPIWPFHRFFFGTFEPSSRTQGHLLPTFLFSTVGVRLLRLAVVVCV